MAGMPGIYGALGEALRAARAGVPDDAAAFAFPMTRHLPYRYYARRDRV